MTKFYVEIPKQKAELPAIIVLGVVCFVGWAFHFGIWGMMGGFIWLGLSVPAVYWLYKREQEPISFKLMRLGFHSAFTFSLSLSQSPGSTYSESITSCMKLTLC